MIGSTLGAYRILELIGGGGFADVYLARDLRSNAVVALKVLHPHMARDPAMLERFDREARLAQRLSEPHVVRILDSGQDGGTRYIAMEYVQGHTLDQLLRQKGRLSPVEAIGLGCQVLQALQAAHSAGVVHRDIKPQNLMLTSGGVLKVMDFGIAKLPATGTRTRIGTYLGTPEYMSPEQAKGETVDGRSDLYSLGITLFELLSGRPPFKAESEWKTLDLHVHAPPPRLSQFRTDVPGALADALLRALQKQPGERFQSAEEMRLALVAAGREQVAQPQRDRRSTPATGVRPTAARTGPGSRRSQWIPIGAAALALTFFGALVLASSRVSQSGSLGSALTATATSLPGAPVASAPTPTPLPPALADWNNLLASLDSGLWANDLRRAAGEIEGYLLTYQDLSPAEISVAREKLYAASVELGRRAGVASDFGEAKVRYERALELLPGNALAEGELKKINLWLDGDKAYRNQDWQRAVDRFDELARIDRNFGSAWEKLFASQIELSKTGTPTPSPGWLAPLQPKPQAAPQQQPQPATDARQPNPQPPPSTPTPTPVVWTITLSVTASEARFGPSAGPGPSPKMTAVINRPVDGTGYFIRIQVLPSGGIVRTCNTGSVCAWETRPIGESRYVAVVTNGSNVVAKSNEVTLVWRP